MAKVSRRFIGIMVALSMVISLSPLSQLEIIRPARAQTISVQGTLTEPNGTTPVSGAWVTVHDSNWSVSKGMYTTSTGAFSFEDLSTNTYIFDVYANNSQFPNPDSMSISVTSGQATSLGTITLKNPNITGRVTLPDGSTGIPNTYVYIHNANWSVSKYTYTTSDGYFNLYTSASDVYTLEMYSTYTVGTTTYWPTDTQSFSHTGTQSTQLGVIKYRDSNVTGIITRPDGVTSVSGVGVNIHTADWSYSRYISSASDGSFGLYAPAGTYTLEIYSNSEDYPSPAPSQVTVTAGQTTALGAVRLSNPTVMGKVTKADGTTPVSGASVTVRTPNWSYNTWKTTNASGEFKMNLTTTGSYILEVYSSDTLESNPDPISFTFTSGQTNYFDGTNGSSVIKLQAPALRGKILKPDGTAASGASVYVHDSTYNYTNSRWGYADSSGIFKIDTLPTGSYTFEITPPWDTKGLVGPDPFDINLTKGSTETTYLTTPLSLMAALKTITGTVVNPDGTKVTDAYVNAWKVQGSGWAQTETDSQGQFSFLVGKGKWQVSIYPKWVSGVPPKWGYYKSPTTIEFLESNTVAESSNADFTVLPFNSKLKGYVRYPDGSIPPTADYVSVSAWSQGGGSNWSQVDSAGYFEMMLPAGTFNLSFYSNNTTYGTPDLTTVELADKETEDLGTVYFVTKNERIKGRVTDSLGNPLSGQYVSTWKAQGSGWASTQTDANGQYTLLVSPGTWLVSSYPTWSGTGGTAYVSSQDPQRLVLTANETKENINFQFAIADATINGNVKKSDGTVLTDLYGWAFARDANQTRGSGSQYSNLGGSVNAGSFTIKVPAGTWDLGVWMPWGSDYSATSETPVTVSAGQTINDAAITVLPNDATISGKMVDSSGKTITDVWGSVFADNGSGGYQWANIQNGEYSMKVAAGTWKIGFWVDWASGYLNQPPENNKVTVAAQGSKTFDLLLQKADSTISGTVYDPSGAPLANAWVNADTEFGAHKSEETDFWRGWNQGNITDKNGKFSLKVPAGEYFVTASLPPDMGYINPEATKVIVDASNPADLKLAFKVSDAAVAGTVKLNDQPNAAFVWGWSEKGGYSEHYTTDGSYTLAITKNDVWHVGAVYETSTSYYTSAEQILNVGDVSSVQKNITLSSSAQTLPAAVTLTFNSDKSQILRLDDGTEINFPANSLSSTAVSVTVTATPKAQIPTQAGARPVGLAYDLEARYASGTNSGQLITAFPSDVLIAIPYTDSQLTELGITEDDLIPMYYDETAGSWKNVENVVVDKDSDTVTFTVKHFTNFAITTGKVSQTAASSTPTLTVTSPANNEEFSVDSVIVAGTVSDATSTVTIQLNGTGTGAVSVASNGGFSQTLTGLQAGANTITIDAVKNTSSAPTVTRTVRYTVGEKGDNVGLSPTGIEQELIMTARNGGPHIRTFDRHGNQIASFFAFDRNLRGEFFALSADVSGDSEKEIIVYPSKGFSPHIRIFDRKGRYLGGFFSHGKIFREGITVRAADIQGDGKADIIVAPAGKGGPNVRVFRYDTSTSTFELLDWFMAYDANFRGKFTLVTADITGDGSSEIITAPQQGGPNVRVYSWQASSSSLELLDWFMPYDEKFTGGLNVTVGNVLGDSLAEIVVAPASQGGPNVRVYAYDASSRVFSASRGFMAYQDSYRGGTSITLGDMNGDSLSDIITLPSNGSSNVRVFAWNESSSDFGLLDWFWAGASTRRGEYSVAVSNIDGDSLNELVVWPKQNASPEITLYEYNASTSQFEVVDALTAFDSKFRGAVSLRVLDLEGDGRSELIVSPLTRGGPQVVMYGQNGQSSGDLRILGVIQAYAGTFRGGVKVSPGK